ncbi:putative membrane protein [Pararhizobium capsulatum DSM 1112]|uniref:Membrane protein n=1 Tax=Pararhizobium capsulatum DSM 1112 TaxID=1121113 RepID=A0ABU0BPP2_9HYPH|nr:DUF2157 domain-containing protein [Pararhizobium capsulatum]MDQ0320216.1 putative membrane protein [Pararhizobium capsulatum DSM 1112]
MYRARIEKDFNLWVEKGLVGRSATDAMLAEYDARPSSFSAGRVLMTLAGVLLAAAVLLLVAANWEAIPRIARVVGIIGLIWTFYLGAAFAVTRGANAIGAALLVMATISFGGAIALVGQMYHLSGDAADALIVWFLAACVATVLFRSAPLAVISGVLSWWIFIELIFESDASLEGNGYIFLVPILVVVTVALVRYTGAGLARHLAYLLALGWLGWLYTEAPEAWLAATYFIVGLIAFLLAALPVSPLRRLALEAGAAPAFYSFALALLGLVALHMEMEALWQDGVIGAVALGLSLVGIGVAGRLNGAVRFLGYAAFAGELLFLSSETIGSILGTSGFFLISGVVVAVIAFAVIRIERKLSTTPAATEV